MKTKLLMTTAALALMLGAGGVNAQTQPSNATPDQATTQKKMHDADMNRHTTGQAQTPSKAEDSKEDSKAAPAAKASESNAPAGKDAAQNKASGAQPKHDEQPKAAQSKPSAAPDNKAASDTKSPATGKGTAQSKDTAPAAANKSSTTQPSAAQQSDPKAAKTNEAASPKAAPSNTQQSASDSKAQPATRASASLQAEQKTKLTEAVAKIDVKPVSKVNFSVSVGTAVPTSVTLHPVPTTIVSIVPQYRGYDFFMVRDEVVIVEPRTHKIVDVIERRGGGAHASTTTRERKVNLSEKQRSYIRQHATSRKTTTTTTTTGSAPRGETVIVGEEVPQSVVIEEFPEEVYREVPAVRSYRYIRSGSDVYLVEPGSRRIIEEIE